MDWKLWGLLIAFALMVAVYWIKQYWPSYVDENVVEEKAEEILKNTTGVDVDLTPDAPEKN